MSTATSEIFKIKNKLGILSSLEKEEKASFIKSRNSKINTSLDILKRNSKMNMSYD
jgi:hypothetical protein